METLKLPVHGMTCGGCVRSVTQVLSAVPGVFGVEVKLEDASASIDYDPERVSRDEMVAAIKGAGFESQ